MIAEQQIETIDLLVPPTEAAMPYVAELGLEEPSAEDPSAEVNLEEPSATEAKALFMDNADSIWLRSMLRTIDKTTTSASHYLRRLVELAEERDKREQEEYKLSLDRRRADLQADLQASELEHDNKRRRDELRVERERWLRNDVTRPAMAAGTVIVTMLASKLGLFPGWLGDLLAMLFGGQ